MANDSFDSSFSDDHPRYWFPRAHWTKHQPIGEEISSHIERNTSSGDISAEHFAWLNPIQSELTRNESDSSTTSFYELRRLNPNPLIKSNCPREIERSMSNCSKNSSFSDFPWEFLGCQPQNLEPVELQSHCSTYNLLQSLLPRPPPEYLCINYLIEQMEEHIHHVQDIEDRERNENRKMRMIDIYEEMAEKGLPSHEPIDQDISFKIEQYHRLQSCFF